MTTLCSRITRFVCLSLALAAFACHRNRPADPGPAVTRKEIEDRLTKEYRDQFAVPYPTASRGALDDVIEPRLLRQKVIAAFQFLRRKRRTGEQDHLRNIPL